jgi:hypothetical protein
LLVLVKKSTAWWYNSKSKRFGWHSYRTNFTSQ